MAKRTRKLSPQQDLFCREYVACNFNGTQAAINAKYSRKTARVQASDLLTRPNVQARIAELKAERIARLNLDSDELLLRLRGDLDADIADLIDDDGTVLPVSDWPTAFRQGLVAGMDVEEVWEGTGKDRKLIGHVKKLRLADRTKIKELFGRHTDIQAWKDNHSHQFDFSNLTDEQLAAIVAKFGGEQ